MEAAKVAAEKGDVLSNAATEEEEEETDGAEIGVLEDKIREVGAEATKEDLEDPTRTVVILSIFYMNTHAVLK